MVITFRITRNRQTNFLFWMANILVALIKGDGFWCVKLKQWRNCCIRCALHSRKDARFNCFNHNSPSIYAIKLLQIFVLIWWMMHSCDLRYLIGNNQLNKIWKTIGNWVRFSGSVYGFYVYFVFEVIKQHIVTARTF